jgi:hypothetical protein
MVSFLKVYKAKYALWKLSNYMNELWMKSAMGIKYFFN